ncbi:TonB-dependent receptor domain-containing protein [Phenylobacterium sp. J367]|uniref:TonB-dependent receptor domain-containing protein n=1 Tax=Phenylobacterium sp. J367 TaxID=2898435 RepID=UPI002150E2CE|nr:TonB-dependent receptor [Phenylobacterium sp. J367]MCR5877126.1 TonB-dependent receptor [Phenylobacterium sp. J367]
MLRTALLGSAAAASLLALPTFAQAQASDVAVDEIVVTGSRIRRPELTSVQPLQVINTETMEERGFTNVADALNDLPSSGIPISPIGDQGSFGVGRNFINIFNLGSNRTLTLVNGRRFVGGNPASIFTGAAAGGQVDLNVIPTGLVDRIETIQAGGSAVYGSDAIAGVINVITRTDFEGVEIDGQYGVSGENDAEEWRGRITAGRKFFDDRLSLSGSYEYNETSTLGFVDRERTAEQLTFASNPANTSGTDNIPGSIIIFNRRIPEVTLGGLPFRANAAGTAIAGTSSANVIRMPDGSLAQFAPGGALVPYNFGTFYSSSVASGGDGLNLAELSSLQSPVKRHVATAFARYEVTDSIRVNGEFFWSQFDAEEPYNQPIYNAPLFGGTSSALRMSTANPFLPAASRAILLAQPTPLPADPANPGERIFFLSRASIDIGTNKTTAEGDTWRGVLAVDGDLNFLDRDFFWGASFTQGEGSGSFQSPNIIQTRFADAIDVVRDSSGAIVCRSAAARAGGCQPLNLFGLGAPSQAALDYVGVQFESEYKILQTVYEANFGGDIVDLPAGAWSFAAGVEARYEKSDFNPNAPQEAGVGRSAAITALSGKFDTKEWYAETLVPVFGGDFTFPLLNRLEFEGAYRKVDHSQAGKDKAWSYGGRWYPIADLMIRGQKARSFRAPAITELFLPTATSFMTATDPCDFRNIGGGPNPATRRANCQAAFQALGLPANFNLTSNVQAATVQGTTAGNPNLGNEIAKQWTAGFVYQPSQIPGLAVNFDWVNIQLEGAISNFTLTSILQVCYDSPDSPADACSRFTRGNSSTDPTNGQGQILTNGAPTGGGGTATGPSTGYINAGYTNFEGFTAGVDYRIELSDWLGGAFGGWMGGEPGSLNFNFDLYHVERQETSVTGLGFDLNRDHGEIGNAKWRWKLDTNYDRGPLGINWTVNWVDESRFNNDFNIESRYPLKVDDYFLHDASITYDLADVVEGWGMGLDNVRARLVIRNVFDEKPPLGATNSANAYGTYDFIGRYYVLGLTARF